MAVGLAGVLACGEPPAGQESPPQDDAPAVEPASAHHVGDAGMPPPIAREGRALVREGGALAHAPSEAALYVADEDHRSVRRLSLPLGSGSVAYDTGGHPAQALPLADRVLVTVRDAAPTTATAGRLLVLRHFDGALEQLTSIPLPSDAWGIAVSEDESIALVSSAWTHQVSAVDLHSYERLWSVDVPREPRGITIRDSVAYVSHLVGAPITRIDLAGDPSVTPVVLPAAPLRAVWGRALEVQASLGYALLLSPDGSRLFAARHALGAVSPTGWQGASTVDVLLTEGDTPAAPLRTSPQIGTRSDDDFAGNDLRDPAGYLSNSDPLPFAQPRAMVYRRSTDTLLVAGEGNDVLAELDAHSFAPAMQPIRVHQLGSSYRDSLADESDGNLRVAARCGAPTGIALSPDDRHAYVWCRSTYDLAIVDLDGDDAVATLHIADDPLNEDAAIGRRLFYSAVDEVTSGGMACAGCHPDGRDDGFVWREETSAFDESSILVSSSFMFAHALPRPDGRERLGVARQTPMLAGRVDEDGPYGWHGDSPTLAKRIEHGFALHRWFTLQTHDSRSKQARAKRLAAFLREGLVPPPRDPRPLTEIEQHGRDVFMAESTACSQCHVPERSYSHSDTFPLSPRQPTQGFRRDPRQSFKVPSLKFVGGTAPYLHDGSARSLEELLAFNFDRMGRTSHLSREDRSALIAFLKTL